MTAGCRSLLAIVSLLASGVAGAQDPKPRPDPRPRPPLDTARAPGDTARPRLPADTARPRPGDTSPGTPTAGGTASLVGRYRVTLNGVTVHRQTYDNPLQTDGKGDEVYLAAWVAAIDTAGPQLVRHRVVASRVLGDASGFPDRLRAGSLGAKGGLRTGDRIPSAAPQKRAAGPAADSLPLLLWEGELAQGRSAVLVAPTVWEWDAKPELFAYWMVSRGPMLARLVEPRILRSLLDNRTYVSQEVGAPGFVVRTNHAGDPRDRPIGLVPGRPSGTAGITGKGGFVEPRLRAGADTAGLAGLRGATDAITGQIFGFGGAMSALREFIEKMAGLFANWFADVVARSPLGPILVPGRLGAATEMQVALPWDDAVDAEARRALRAAADSMAAAGVARPRVPPLPTLVPTLRSAERDPRADDYYFFEQLVALTPAAIEEALKARATPTRPAGGIDVVYVDHPALAGRYTLHLQVERLP